MMKSCDMGVYASPVATTVDQLPVDGFTSTLAVEVKNLSPGRPVGPVNPVDPVLPVSRITQLHVCINNIFKKHIFSRYQ